MFVSNMGTVWIDLLSCRKGWKSLEGGASLGPKYKRAGIPTKGFGVKQQERPQLWDWVDLELSSRDSVLGEGHPWDGITRHQNFDSRFGFRRCQQLPGWSRLWGPLCVRL